MELLHKAVDLFLHLDTHLKAILETYGAWTYGLLFLTIFCETGLVVTPFLPGDSLLFAAGAFAARGAMRLEWLIPGLFAAAVLGDNVNYAVGYLLGPKLAAGGKLRFVKPQHLARTHAFYERYGGKTLVLARFVPIVRTFAPFVAGVGSMRYLKFLAYSLGGGLAWVLICTLAGYFFGNLPFVQKNFSLVVLAIVFVSLLPAVVEIVRARRPKYPPAMRWPTLALAVVSLLLLAGSGVGVRMGLWDFRTGFNLLRWTFFLGVAAAILAVLLLIAMSLRGARGRGALVLALVVGLGAAYVPWSQLRKARTVPPIHDITTDTADPPLFVAILPLRAGAKNKVEYGGEEVAAKQRQAYPDVQPLHLEVAPAEAFARALAAARGMGWEIVEQDAQQGRIEATATTFWFAFKDDVVVRLRPDGTGTRIDVRSLSRVGGSDVGKNAQRVRAYLARLRS